jgi:hypothetical protein
MSPSSAQAAPKPARLERSGSPAFSTARLSGGP